MNVQRADGGQSRTPDSILIVDDTVANLLAFSAILKKLDCRLVLAGNGREGLARAQEEEFTVILMDVRMPELNGFESAELIRRKSRNHNTPILFLSAFEAPPLHIFSSFVGGKTDFLSSPVDGDTLLKKVAEFLRRSSPQAGKDPPSDPNLQKTSEGSGALPG